MKATGAKVISSATTVREAIWLEERGCDAIIAQGFEAGGHRGIFLSEHADRQVGTMALVPQVVDAVKVPVIAAGGIADARGIVAALALGASAVQIGTAYLFCPEAKIVAPHRAALKAALDDDTVLTRVFTGRPARGIVNRVVREVGAMSELPPEFPLAGGALMPLRAKSEPAGSGDFTPLWSGQAMRLGREMPAAEAHAKALVEEAQALLKSAAWPANRPRARETLKAKRARLSPRPFRIRIPAGSGGVFAFGLLLAGEFLAGRLVDDLHRQADLAALVEAHQLDPDLVAFLDDVGGLVRRGRRRAARCGRGRPSGRRS